MIFLRFLLLIIPLAAEAEWSEPVVVRHELTPVVTYRARLDGDLLAVHVKIEPTWHTFAMDNKRRAEEKLAGRQSLGIDQPTEIKLTGLETTGPWLQTAPRDFSKPELRWFAFGYEGEALFAAKVRRAGNGPAQLQIRGQACTDTTCKNIDVEVPVPASTTGKTPAVDTRGLIEVRR
jgi:hypothetical protein